MSLRKRFSVPSPAADYHSILTLETCKEFRIADIRHAAESELLVLVKAGQLSGLLLAGLVARERIV